MRARVETVRIDGLPVRLHTVAPAGRVRDPAGTTVAFVHGIGMSHRSFVRSQRAVGAGHRTVAVDLPGFGRLPAAGRRLDMAELGDLVVRAVRSRGAGDLVLVGQSMGAQVVAEAARQHPDTVRSLVLVGPVIAAERRSVALAALDLARDGLVETARMNGVLIVDYLRGARQYSRELGPMMRYRLEDTLAGLEQPVLVVRGTRDPIARHDWSARLASTARQGVLTELPGPHHVQERQPVAFARLVDEFQRVPEREAR